MKGEVTFHRFKSEIKFFLSQLLQHPLNADISGYLKDIGFDRKKLIRALINRGVIKRQEKILLPNKDAENTSGKPQYNIKYNVVRKDFERKLRNMFIEYFESNTPNDETLDECCSCGSVGGGSGAFMTDMSTCSDGGATSNVTMGATGSENSGQYVAPLTGAKKKKKKGESDVIRREIKEQKSIYLTEKQVEMLEESQYIDTNKVISVVNYLNQNYKKGVEPIVNASGRSGLRYSVGLKARDGSGTILQNMSAQQLLDDLMDRFQYYYANDKKTRYNFLKLVMIDWYNGKISKEGIPTSNRF